MRSAHRGLLLLSLIAVLTALAAGPAGAGELSPADYYRTYQAAEEKFSDGEFADAAKLYDTLLVANPDDGYLMRRLAISQHRAGQADQRTLELFIQASELGHGRESSNAFRIAGALAQAGQTDQALRWIERSLEGRYERRDELQDDDDFESLRADARFRKLAGFKPEGEVTRDQAWRRDLDFFLMEARRLHADPSRYVLSDEFAAAVSAVKAKVPTFDDQQLAAEVMRLLVSLDDGHTALRTTSSDEFPWLKLPLRFYFFEDGLFIIDAAEEHRGLIGSKVVAIGGHPLTSVLDDVAPWVSRDNRMGLLSNAPWRLRTLALLQAMGYADDSGEVALTVEGGDRVRREVGITAISPNEHSFSWRLPAPRGTPDDQRPLWLEDSSNNFWERRLPEMKALYVQFNAVQHKHDQSIGEYAEELVRGLQEKPAKNLILDLRHNGGGNNFLIWPLVRLVAFHEMSDPSNRTFVITSRATFSACQDFVNFLDRSSRAVFVGEPSGSRPNFTGESSRVTLPYSGLQMSISSRYWQDSWPEDRRPWVSVQLPAPLSSKDYFANQDPAMLALQEILGGEEETRAANAAR